MFYQGDLKSGIEKALAESKLVACFVTDSGEESQLWENEFLQEDSLKSALADKTILLRLVAGSEEAGYLAAIFPLPQTPTFVLIHNGNLKEYIASGVQKDEFLKRLEVVMASRGAAETSPATSTSQDAASSSTAGPSSSTQQATTSTNARVEQQTAHLQEVLAERSARLEKQKAEQDAKEKKQRAADAKARREAAESANPRSAADHKYAQQQRQRQQEAREEKARILKRVEDDKAARREAAAARKAQREGKGKEVEISGDSSSASVRGANAKECAVQVRLFDGSTIRSRFPSSGTLAKDVRSWVDEKQEGDVPYTFKQVLSPLPNKNIEASEEEKSLADIGLTPSATLILLPVAGYISAYEGNSNLVSKAVSGGYGIVSSGVGMVTGVLGSFLGGSPSSGPAQTAPPPRQPGAPSSPSVAINVRSLRDREPKKDKQQFYNGNATNFEPRKDDEDGKDD
ncbi:uncharacterized protein L3040_005978 [Drepanopeziza brunnea f. sp. 'multigermtubi']|uniref:UBX domain-containing protein 2 n=1 Tax=Marssonina brunnea f. sp. multigermtubi (strain MB_m1) TaxID=1072389 RepID=K1WE66_MARBU|nr:UBX domain-containing protein [Drepanopeziza brunnea f. sp. 'multigermtubi' MB_m1]EKD15675.1 UBX domain-containing protein [Drepanopeziza brunnea f. sp. 'multigermtubi' MB_m1]KAJ5040321.1 hypothetical protein L3040_005978 [Drepanopeziza brunnea f. sp. 'multigermtubi']